MNELTQEISHTGHLKTVLIIVNGRRHEVRGPSITFEQLVALAFPEPPYGEFTAFTVTYRTPTGNHRGMLAEGEKVKVIEGMIFDVRATDKS